jgi:hypothetical protein
MNIMKSFEVRDPNVVTVDLSPNFAANLATFILDGSDNPAFQAFAHQIRTEANDIEPENSTNTQKRPHSLR